MEIKKLKVVGENDIGYKIYANFSDCCAHRLDVKIANEPDNYVDSTNSAMRNIIIDTIIEMVYLWNKKYGDNISVKVEVPKKDNGNVEFHLYSEVMNELYGKDWDCNTRVCSKEEGRASKKMYNYICRKFNL